MSTFGLIKSTCYLGIIRILQLTLLPSRKATTHQCIIIVPIGIQDPFSSTTATPPCMAHSASFWVKLATGKNVPKVLFTMLTHASVMNGVDHLGSQGQPLI